MVFMWTETCRSSLYNFNYFNNLRITFCGHLLYNKVSDIIDAWCNHEIMGRTNSYWQHYLDTRSTKIMVYLCLKVTNFCHLYSMFLFSFLWSCCVECVCTLHFLCLYIWKSWLSEDKNCTHGFKRCTVFQFPQFHNAVTSTHTQQDRTKYKLIQTAWKLNLTLTDY